MKPLLSLNGRKRLARQNGQKLSHAGEYTLARHTPPAKSRKRMLPLSVAGE